MRVTTTVECSVHNSFRVQAVAGLFDVPIAERAKQEFSVEVPGLEEDWQIGAIIGPSGSGKSTISKAAFGDNLWNPVETEWARDKAVIDNFNGTVKEITKMLTAVGFSSPPAWIRPYHVLSNGEKFRCDLARALLSEKPVIAFDEFTSVIDRTVAKTGSAAVSKAIRKGNIKRRFVAITCHSDIVEWLCPDWVVDMATNTLARGSLRRPQIALEIVRCDREAWGLFKKHHYLDASLHHSATCYMALWNGEPVAFCAVLQNYGWKGFYRIHRVVCLPDYQGIGIGTRLTEDIAEDYHRRGCRMSLSSGHQAVVRHCERSPLWKVMKNGVKKMGNNAQTETKADGTAKGIARGRAIVAFEYVGAKGLL